MQTFRDIGEEAYHFRSMQVGRYTHAYSITLRVPHDRSTSQTAVSPAALKRSAILAIEEDADFHITHMTCAVMAPVAAASDVRDALMTTKMQMAGVDSGRSDRGLAFRMSEMGGSRMLGKGQTIVQGPNQMAFNADTQSWWWAREGYLAVESVFPPSYGFEFSQPVAFDYHLVRNRKILVEFINRDSDYEIAAPFLGNGGHVVTFAFLGQRYDA